jgi:hypothetical protein
VVQQTTNKVIKIKEKMKMAQDRQKSYVKRRRPLESEENYHIFLRITPTMGVGKHSNQGS